MNPTRMRTARRPLIRGAASLIGAAAGASCGPVGNPASTDRDTPAGEPKDIVVATPTLATNQMVADQTVMGAYRPNCYIFERLTQCDENYQLKPMLAERWELINGGATWRFFLRKGITFHDGSPFTAQDVVFTFERAARRGGRPINAVEGSAKAVDDYTVDFTPAVRNLKVPWRMADLGHGNAHIIKAGTDPSIHPMGTGPLKFVSFRPDESIKVERYDNYWDKPNGARVKSVLFRLIPDSNARVLALRAGDADIVFDVPRDAVSELKRDSKLKVFTSGVGGFNAVYVNSWGKDEWGITADKNVRRALAMGMNREEIVRQVYDGNAEISRTLVPPAQLGAYKDRVKGPPAFDQAGARRLLEDAGWRAGPDGIRIKDGRRLEIVIASGYPSAEVQRPIPEVLQKQLRQIGAEVKIAEQPMSNLVADGQLRFHFWLEAFGPPEPDPTSILRFYQSPAAGNTGNYGKFGPGGAVDEAIAKSDQTSDIARTQEIVADGLRALLEDEVTVIPLAATYKIWATGNRIDVPPLSPVTYVDHVHLAHKR